MRILTCILFLALAACGQKGQLYLPEAPPSQEAQPVAGTGEPATPAEETEEGKTTEKRR